MTLFYPLTNATTKIVNLRYEWFNIWNKVVEVSSMWKKMWVL
jgi:hypothetical protein